MLARSFAIDSPPARELVQMHPKHQLLLKKNARRVSDGDKSRLSEGFNLHAGVRIGRRQWSRLEKLCRYIARPPLDK
ncbi:MAG: hypothetical protein ACI8RZ_001265 [Myxococcota bacterium]